MIWRTKDDLDLARIAESGQTFRWEEREKGVWRVIAGAQCTYVSQPEDGCIDLDCGEEAFRSFWRGYLDLDEDYAAVRARIRRDREPYLWLAAESQKGIRILRQDPFEMLISFIISQNKNIPAIRRSIALLAQASGALMEDGRGEPYHAFPTAEALAALPEKKLRACGLGYRCGYVHAAAEAASEGRIDLDSLKRADEKTALRALTELYGVGPKVARCVSLFGLHHTDAFPEDVWIRRVLSEHFPDGYPYEVYSPYNGIYQQYLFAFVREEDGGTGKRKKQQ